MLAAETGHVETIYTLLTADPAADIEMMDNDGNTALHHASMWGKEEAIRALIEAGANYEIRNAYGFLAVDYGRTIEIVNFVQRMVKEAQRQRAGSGGSVGSNWDTATIRSRAGGVRLVTDMDSFDGAADSEYGDGASLSSISPVVERNVLPSPTSRGMPALAMTRSYDPQSQFGRPGTAGGGMDGRVRSGSN